MRNKTLERTATALIVIGLLGKLAEKILSSTNEIIGYIFYVVLYFGLLLSFINNNKTRHRIDKIIYTILLVACAGWLIYDAYAFLTR